MTQVIPLSVEAFENFDDGQVEACWFKGTDNGWRLSQYAPLVVYLLFAVYVLQRTSRNRDMSVSSRKKVFDRMLLVLVVFVLLWLFP